MSPGAPPSPVAADRLIVPHIAVVNHSTIVDDRDLAFAVEAVNRQMREHVAPLWEGAPPGIFFYGKSVSLPANQSALLGIVDDDGNADSAGYHSAIADLIYGLVDARQARILSRTLAHEADEMYGNPRLSRKVPGPKNRYYYVELNDPVQRRQYEIEATVLGETRKVIVSDFVLPAWFDLPNNDNGRARGARTYLGMLDAEQDMDKFEVAPGGYQIAEELDGEIVHLSKGEARMNRSKHGRTNRIIERRFALVA